MSEAPQHDSRVWTQLLAAVVGIVVPFLWLLSTVTPSEVAVRIRNALGAQVGEPADFDWTPERVPESFLYNEAEVPAGFSEIATRVLADYPSEGDGSAFDIGLVISRDLMSSAQRVGGPIRADSESTYKAITKQGRGYCADFVKSFIGIALAADIPVRQWGFAFSAFGSGHTFNEVYDRGRQKWILIDSFHSVYFVDSLSRRPLSVIEVHDRLLGFGPGTDRIALERIVPARFPFRTESAALDYYRRGMTQLWLVWGNNLFDFESRSSIRMISGLSRAMGQLTGRLSGVYPTIRIYPEGVSERDLRELFRARDEFLLAGTCCLVSVFIFGAQILQNIGRRRRRESSRRHLDASDA